MKISKASAATLGHIIADALHDCDNIEQRRGVLRLRDRLIDRFHEDCQKSEADWDRYCAFQNRFQERIDFLEKITK